VLPESASSRSGVLDSHSHAWRRWPYQPAVPDEEGRGSLEQLVFEMDTNGVEQAMVVCAAIGGNPDNTEYVASVSERYPGRFHVVADLDCTWSSTYHKPGCVDRLRELADRYKIVGITHYLEEHNDGWLLSEEADALFTAAGERRLLVSIAAGPSWQADLRVLAGRHLDVPVLCHHLGDLRVGDSAGLDEVVASAAVSNIYVKASGFHYALPVGWDYPWPAALQVLSRIFDAYGAGRLCWGSDFSASKRFCTFRQSLEAVRTHCEFLTPEDVRLVMGETLRGILAGIGAI
jgi:L-fuconolactonase